MFRPKDIKEDHWKKLEANRAYAVRSFAEDVVHMRFGMGIGVFLNIVPTQYAEKIVYAVDYQTGEGTILFKISEGAPVTIGRSSESSVKIVHGYISRLHVELVLDTHIFMIKDLGSTNGTYVYSENAIFDIENYLEGHPLDKAKESTMDAIHEAFGPTVDDFLKRYSERKEKKNDTSIDNTQTNPT